MAGPYLTGVSALFPEIFLVLSALVLLMLGAFRGDRTTPLICWLAVLAVAIDILLVARLPAGRQVVLSGLFVSDAFSRFAKLLVLVASGLSIVLSMTYLKREKIAHFEFPVLMLIATTGMLMMVSANDLLSLYISIELQSLALYVLAAFDRDNLRASEAGLKYFVLGALASGMMLYGCSLIYGFGGTTNFSHLATLLQSHHAVPVGLIVGIVFLSVGLAFKVSAVPFHMWTPDVYEGAPTPVTAFFAVAPKVAAIVLFVRAMEAPFGSIGGDWQQIVVFLSIASMVLGAFAGIAQRNIKRLMAYSSISHAGFALIGLAAGTAAGIRGLLIYMAIYIVMTLGAFGVTLCMRRSGVMVEEIADLAGLARRQPGLALAMVLFMFSLAGVPPLAGFFGKFYIFMAAIDAHLYTLAVVGVLSSVVGAYYYLHVVKVMYFDAPAEPLEQGVPREMTIVLALTGLFTLLFFVYPAPLVSSAQAAAAVFFH